MIFFSSIDEVQNSTWHLSRGLLYSGNTTESKAFTFVHQYSTSFPTKIGLIYIKRSHLSSRSMFQLTGNFPFWQLICCWLRSHLPAQSHICPQGTVTSTITHHAACLQQSHKEPEASDRGCVIVLLANGPMLSRSKGLFTFLLYLRQHRHNELSVGYILWHTEYVLLCKL